MHTKPIHDGHTRDGVAPVRARGLDEIHFTYRPAPAPAELLAAGDPRGSVDEHFHALTAFLAERLCSWDVRDPLGRSVPLTADALALLPYPVLADIHRTVTGPAVAEAHADAGRLRRGIWLILQNPSVAYRSCDDCRKFVHNDRPEGGGERWAFGEQILGFDGMRRKTIPVLRNPGDAPPCGHCPKVPKGEAPVPESAVELNDRGWETYRFHLSARAVGYSAAERADWLVFRDAGIIAEVIDAHGRAGASAVGHKIDGLAAAIFTFIKATR